MDKTKYHLRWRSHLNCLNSAIGTLYRNEKYTDVVLFSSSQSTDNNILPNVGIPAHKFILSACSEYFASIFDNVSQSTSNGMFCVVMPPELSHCTLQILVEYIYNGEATVTEDLLNEVVRGGQILKIRGLYEYHAQRQHSGVIGSSDMLNVTSVSGNDLKETLVHLAPVNQIKNKNNAPYKPIFSAAANIPEQSAKKYTRLSKNGHTPRISVNKQVAIDPELRSTPKEGFHRNLVARDISLTPSPPPSHTDHHKATLFEQSNSESETNLGLIKHEPPDWTGSWSELSSAHDTMTTANSMTNVKLEVSTDVTDNESQHYTRCSSCDICKNRLSDAQLRMDQHTSKDKEIDDSAMASINKNPNCASITSSAAKIKVNKNDKNINHSNFSTDNFNTENYEPKIIVPKKRRRTSQQEVADHVTLLCDLCNTAFEGAADWVRHMNNEHTEIEMAIFNSKMDLEQKQAQSNMRNAVECDFIDNPSTSNKISNNDHYVSCHRKKTTNKLDQNQQQQQVTSSHDHHHENNGRNHETCSICKTKYPTHKSIMMHQCKHITNYSSLKRSSTSSLLSLSSSTSISQVNMNR